MCAAMQGWGLGIFLAYCLTVVMLSLVAMYWRFYDRGPR